MAEKTAFRFIKKAVAYEVQFTSKEIYDLSGYRKTKTMRTLLDFSKCRFTKEQLKALYTYNYDESQQASTVNEKIFINKLRLRSIYNDKNILHPQGTNAFS